MKIMLKIWKNLFTFFKTDENPDSAEIDLITNFRARKNSSKIRKSGNFMRETVILVFLGELTKGFFRFLSILGGSLWRVLRILGRLKLVGLFRLVRVIRIEGILKRRLK